MSTPATMPATSPVQTSGLESFAAQLVLELPQYCHKTPLTENTVQRQRRLYLEALLQELLKQDVKCDVQLTGAEGFKKGKEEQLKTLREKLGEKQKIPLAIDTPFFPRDTYQSHTLRQMLSHSNYHVLEDRTLVNAFILQNLRMTRIFNTFLSHSNEKRQTVAHLEGPLAIIASSPMCRGERCVYSDVGYGTGILTQKLAGRISPYLEATTQFVINGIEIQRQFVEQANTEIRKVFPSTVLVDLRIGNFRDSELPREFRAQASIVMASHILYYVRDEEKTNLVAKIHALGHTNGAIAIYIHELSSPITTFRTKYQQLLRPSSTANINKKIEMDLIAKQLPYIIDTFAYSLNFPRMDDNQWERLYTLPEPFSEKQYENESLEWRETKNLLEFLLMDPLEYIPKNNLKTLINEFRQLLKECNYNIPITNQIIFVGLGANGANAVAQLRPQMTRCMSAPELTQTDEATASSVSHM